MGRKGRGELDGPCPPIKALFLSSLFSIFFLVLQYVSESGQSISVPYPNPHNQSQIFTRYTYVIYINIQNILSYLYPSPNPFKNKYMYLYLCILFVSDVFSSLYVYYRWTSMTKQC